MNKLNPPRKLGGEKEKTMRKLTLLHSIISLPNLNVKYYNVRFYDCGDHAEVYISRSAQGYTSFSSARGYSWGDSECYLERRKIRILKAFPSLKGSIETVNPSVSTTITSGCFHPSKVRLKPRRSQQRRQRRVDVSIPQRFD